ncbi:MAG TPA: type II secretion system protein GspG [Planctomycetales bacterium]|jgi:general secretion pathway protein G|nr:type II secretion system protein GspG [Planctomycetales bacterium]
MLALTRKRKSSRIAFTLVEMLVVVAIILALAAMAVPIAISVYDGARRDIAQSQIKGTLVPAVERYRMDAGDLPSSLQDLVSSPKAGLKADQLSDPWGAPYQFSPQSSHGNEYDIWSQGSGGKPVGNWKD